MDETLPAALPEPAHDDSGKDAGIQRIISEAYEAASLSALMDRNKKADVTKKPATSVQKAGLKKKPAAAVSAMINWDPNWKGNRKSWCSKHYHEARNVALKSGESDADAKMKAQAAHAVAAELWEKHQI